MKSAARAQLIQQGLFGVVPIQGLRVKAGSGYSSAHADDISRNNVKNVKLLRHTAGERVSFYIGGLQYFSRLGERSFYEDFI
jgi:hypothetical protein